MGLLDQVFHQFGYEKRPKPALSGTVVTKSTDKESLAQNPLSMAYAAINSQFGLRRPSKITLQTLRQMSRANWVDRTCIFTLRDEITHIPFDISPIDPKKPFNEDARRYFLKLFNRPNPNNENWRTFIDKVLEDVLVGDSGCIEKVRNGKGEVVELYHVDGLTIKPIFDEHGMAGDPAYQQFLPDQKQNTPVAEFKNEDMIYIMWNPQGAIDTFGWGMSPVEAGLAVGTAFLYAEAYNLGFFQHNTIPPVIIQMGKDVPAGEVDKFRMFLSSEIMGPEGFHNPIVGSFGEGFDVKEILKHPGDMAWEKYVEWQMRWKVALYRMSPQDIGFTLDQYKVEGQVQQQLSKNKAISSLKDVLADYLNLEVLNDEGFGDIAENLQFSWIDQDVVDPVDQATVDKTYVTNGIMKPNEIRTRLGLDPVEGGDDLVIVSGSQITPLDSIRESAEAAIEQKKNPPAFGAKPGQDPTNQDKNSDVKKNFSPEEGQIIGMAGNQTAVAWMDDRGVTQPLFVSDYGKSKGFMIKASFLDDRKDQEPPEQEVASILRLLKVNTPEVRIASYDEVLTLLPEHLYADWTRYINLEAPYDSKEWRDRWGETRKSPYYIVSGLITGRDLGNEGLQKDMAATPDSYMGAVRDLARVWLAERKYYLGDRKPGHYIVTDAGNGFGVDYQFYEDQGSWERTNHFLPDVLALIDPSLGTAFKKCVQDEAADFGIEKAFKAPIKPDDWQRQTTLTDLEKRLAQTVQKKITTWYLKTVRRAKSTTRSVRKANTFDPTRDYLVSGTGVYQDGVKYSLSVLNNNQVPGPNDLRLNVSDYRASFDFGVGQASLSISTDFPDIKVRNPELYAPQFEKRVNLIADTVDNTMKEAVDNIIIKGIDEGRTYGDIAELIREALAVDPANADFPKWRAERIARTESMWAINEGMRAQYQQTGIDKVDVSVASTACDLCMALLDGNPYTLSEAEGLLPEHPNCVIGGQEVLGLDVSTKFVADYDGPTITITTEKGATCTVTPNHLMLTGRGWVPASKLDRSDDLVYTCPDFEKMIDANPDIKAVKSLIEQVTIPDEVALLSMPSSPEYFHGDGVFCKDIDIISSYGRLGSHVTSSIGERRNDSDLIRTLVSTGSFNALRFPNELGEGNLSTSGSPMGGDSVSTILERGTATHHQSISGSLISELHALADQTSIDNAPTVSEILGKLVDRFPSLIAFDKIVDIQTNDAFHGKVYDLETAHGWYSVNNIISHNCRCLLVGDYSDLLKSHPGEVTKGWVTINGRHILIGGDAGGGRGAAGGNGGANESNLKVADVPGINYRATDKLVSHEGAPDQFAVGKYRQLIQSGHPVAPLLVTKEEGNMMGIDDGKHRFQAFRELGFHFVPVLNKDTASADQMAAYDQATQRDATAMAKLPL